MEITEIIQLLINNGMGIGVACYFLWKDYKQSQQRIEADKARAEVDAQQNEVMRQLAATVESLRQAINDLRVGDLRAKREG